MHIACNVWPCPLTTYMVLYFGTSGVWSNVVVHLAPAVSAAFSAPHLRLQGPWEQIPRNAGFSGTSGANNVARNSPVPWPVSSIDQHAGTSDAAECNVGRGVFRRRIRGPFRPWRGRAVRKCLASDMARKASFAEGSLISIRTMLSVKLGA